MRDTLTHLARLATLAAVLLLTISGPAFCGKGNGKGKGGGGGDDGGGDPPPLPGTIAFRWSDDLGLMNADGTDKRILETHRFFGAPTSQLYGSNDHRWYVFATMDGRTYDRVIDENGDVILTDYAHVELMAAAFDDNGNFVDGQPLSDSYGKAIFRQTDNGLPMHSRQLPQWSNDTADSFVSWFGIDIGAAFTVEVDGSTTIDASKVESSDALFKVNISGSDVEAGLVATPQDLTLIPAGPYSSNFHWHPSGSYFVTVKDSAIQMRDADTGAILWTRPSNVKAGSLSWSPLEFDVDSHAAGLMFIEDYQLKVMMADPLSFSDAVTIFVPEGKNGDIWNPLWSPDATHLVVKHLARNGRFGGDWQTLRMTIEGDQQYNLTPNIDAYQGVEPLYWLTNVTN